MNIKNIVLTSKFLVSFLFILSGLIKLNDSVGFSIKLDEYFSPFVFNLPFLSQFSLFIAFFIATLEVILGVFLIINYKLNATLKALFLMLCFFGFLTFYAAFYNKVTDCGCFGDAIKLTPWQSFYKDIVLLLLTLFLYLKKDFINKRYSSSLTNKVILLTTLLTLVITYYTINHLPIVDFRAYKKGVNIIRSMQIPPNESKAVYEYNWVFKKNGLTSTVTNNGRYPSDHGEFISVKTKLLKPSYQPSIHDFNIALNDNDITIEVLNMPEVILIISTSLSNSNTNAFLNLKKYLQTHPITTPIIILTASPINSIDEFKRKFNYELFNTIYQTDSKTLKTIIRSNPGFLLLKHGTIHNKKHYNDFKTLF